MFTIIDKIMIDSKYSKSLHLKPVNFKEHFHTKQFSNFYFLVGIGQVEWKYALPVKRLITVFFLDIIR